MFPAAGLGTRFLPATKAQPKEMLPLVDKPTIQYGVEEAVASGISNLILVTGRGKPPDRLGFNLLVYDGDKRDAAPGENINECRLAWAPRPGIQGRPEDWGRINLD